MSHSPDEQHVRDLYRHLLDAWNARQPDAFAALFLDDGEAIGFDGSQLVGRARIAAELSRVFGTHPTAAFVSIIRNVRFPAMDIAVLRANAGMIPPGQDDINPAVNAVQVMVAARQGLRWRIASCQNTPAQFHERPDLAEELTAELRSLLQRGAA
jgi:uncharacterized protein (TIGR02246 family)